MRIFLAGPFFNSKAISVMHELLNLLDDELGHEVFCAMRDGAKVPPDAPDDIRQKFFKLDYEKAIWADCVVALLDYPLPTSQVLFVADRTPDGIIKHQPVLLPDTGTVFEIGLFFAMKKPIIGFAANIKSLNLMLMQACIKIVTDLYQLTAAINKLAENPKEFKEQMRLFQL